MAAAFLVNLLFWTGISAGGIVFAALVDTTGGRWADPLRNTAERFTRFLPIAIVLLALLMWRSADVYSWARHPAGSAWFAPAFVAARDLVALAATSMAAFMFQRASRRATTSREQPTRATREAIVLLIVYAVAFSLLAVDLIMSLEPRWTSTLFPAYVFTGNVYAGVASMACVAAWSSRKPESAASAALMRDLANVLVGFGLFWAYLFWSQFLVIWYGNVTREVDFMAARIGVSRAPGWIVLAACCAVPAIALVPRSGKTAAMLRFVAPIALVGLWLERWLLVAADVPSRSPVPALLVSALFSAAFVAAVRPLAPD